MLPKLIEVIPPQGPVDAEVTVPGSKSLTNRVLILAALAEGRTQLKGALWSEDTQVMVEALRRLGFVIDVQPDPNESSNRTIEIEGADGRVPMAGTQDNPLEIFVGNAGTAARFLAALVCLGEGYYRLHGVPRMHERPQAALFDALRELGYGVESSNNRLPAVIQGRGPRPAQTEVSIRESSQFASALLLCAPKADWQIQIADANVDEAPYVQMTTRLGEVFPQSGGQFQIEPDASSGSYFWAADYLLNQQTRDRADSNPNLIRVLHWPDSGWQIDAEFPKALPLAKSVSRETDLGDSIMTAIVTAPFEAQPTIFKDLGRLRVQECERVHALKTELSKCGGQVEEQGDTLTITPGPLSGAEIETYDDHRMAMCFAVVGLKVPGIRIQNPACVRKTFPNFFQKLAAKPPQGLGVKILGPEGGVVELE